MIRALTAEEFADIASGPMEAGFGAVATQSGNLPLRSLDVTVSLEALSAQTTVRQRFANVFNEPLEATYIFPLPPRAAVIGFQMKVAGKTIRGRVDERETAREEYTAAIAAGRSAAIVEEERPDVFTIRVGNIPPRSLVDVEFTLTMPVVIDGLEATYRFPLVVAARYCPGSPLDGEPVGDGWSPDTDQVPDASRITPPVLLPGIPSPVQLRIQARLGAAALVSRSKDAAIACSLPVEEEVGDDHTRTLTVRPGQQLDRDFILRWPIGEESDVATSLAIEPDDTRSANSLGSGGPADDAPGKGSFALTVVPPRCPPPNRLPRDVVFVVDRSGSMGGWQMVSAKRAVTRMIESLAEGDRAAVISFDTAIEYFTNGNEPLVLREMTYRTRQSMIEWVTRIDARGGTELARALAFALDTAKAGVDQNPSRSTHVVLITDGQVGHEAAVLQSLQDRLGETRLFVVGIDSAVNEGLLSRLADASGGLTEMVESEARLDEVMQRIQERIATPHVSQLTLSSLGLDIDLSSITPARLPDLVPGLPVVIRGRYRGPAEGGIMVRGVRPDHSAIRQTAQVDPVISQGAGALWARAKLRQLEDTYACTSDNETLSELESRIVSLSTAFGVLCRFTAIVAIDEDQPDWHVPPAAPRRIVQPVVAFSASDCVDYLRASSTRLCPMAPPPNLLARGGFDLAAVPPPIDPLARFRVKAKILLKPLQTRGGDYRSLKQSTVRRFLRRLLRLLAAMGDAGADASIIEPMAAPIGRLYASPGNQPTLEELLDAVAAFSASAPDSGRWWTRQL